MWGSVFHCLRSLFFHTFFFAVQRQQGNKEEGLQVGEKEEGLLINEYQVAGNRGSWWCVCASIMWRVMVVS
jgi:hypothetical protein